MPQALQVASAKDLIAGLLVIASTASLAGNAEFVPVQEVQATGSVAEG